MDHRIELELTIPMGSRWHSGSGEGSLLTDRLTRRDARDRPFIPGSTLKGVIRESCERLARLVGFPSSTDPHQVDIRKGRVFQSFEKTDSPVDRLFGNKRIAGGLFFRDARLPDPPELPNCTRNRIARYRALGTARQGHLFSTEYAPAHSFRTRIDGWHRDLVVFGEEYPPFAYGLLLAGILAVERIGGDKSTGAGWLEGPISIETARYNGAEIDIQETFELLDLPEYRELAKEGGA